LLSCLAPAAADRPVDRSRGGDEAGAIANLRPIPVARGQITLFFNAGDPAPGQTAENWAGGPGRDDHKRVSPGAFAVPAMGGEGALQIVAARGETAGHRAKF
jgi:hypothetical protein